MDEYELCLWWIGLFIILGFLVLAKFLNLHLKVLAWKWPKDEFSYLKDICIHMNFVFSSLHYYSSGHSPTDKQILAIC